MDLIAGKLEISEALAAQLEEHLGSSKEFWLRREREFRDAVTDSVAAILGNIRLPLGEMRRFGWLRSFYKGDGDLAASARFLGITCEQDFEDAYGELEDALAFRRSGSYDTALGSLIAWFRAGQLATSSLDIGKWDPKLFTSQLPGIRELTRERDPAIFFPRLKAACSKAGIALAVVRAPSGCPASGATYFPPGGTPLVILSFRHLSDDHFWFSFFHEAGHVLLHGNRLFVELPGSVPNEREREADEFASLALIPTEFQDEMRSLDRSRYSLVRFARRVGVAPGIIVGQMQHAGILRYNQLNSLKRRYRWRANLEMQ